MTNHFALGMTKATELTKAGKLAEATALIQSLLHDGAPKATGEPDDTVIEGSFTQLDDADPVGVGKVQPADRPAKQPRRRTSLRETLRNIAAAGMSDQMPFAKGSAPLPAGADFITRSHVSRHGQRDYKLYIPATLTSAPMPLIVMLHGCTQSPDDFAAGTG
jgi:Esterase PHB depolymerase